MIIDYNYPMPASWVASYIHACINETRSIANLQDLITTLASFCSL